MNKFLLEVEQMSFQMPRIRQNDVRILAPYEIFERSLFQLKKKLSKFITFKYFEVLANV